MAEENDLEIIYTLASEINRSMPVFVVRKINDALNSHKKPLNGAKIIIDNEKGNYPNPKQYNSTK